MLWLLVISLFICPGRLVSLELNTILLHYCVSSKSLLIYLKIGSLQQVHS